MKWILIILLVSGDAGQWGEVIKFRTEEQCLKAQEKILKQYEEFNSRFIMPRVSATCAFTGE